LPIKIIRALAVILGSFWLGLSLLDILGVIPRSDGIAPLGERLIDSSPIAVAGGFLVLPYRFVRTTGIRIGIAAGLALVIFWLLWMLIGDTRDLVSGTKSWQIIPVTIVFVVVNILNLWAFFRITKQNRFEVDSSGAAH
jgi:hypothetical protein